MTICQPPIGLGDHEKTEIRSQFAALCYRLHSDGKWDILLVTSRRRGRWVLPKGWPVDGVTPSETAMREAFEEAGVVGEPGASCIAHYSYQKVLEDDSIVPCVVAVFPVEVSHLRNSFPESEMRERAWFSPAEAAAKVIESELQSIILSFNPATLHS